MKKKLFLPCLLGLLIQEGPCQTFTSSNLPIIVINTHNQDIDSAGLGPFIVDMGVINNGTGIRNYLTDPYQYTGDIQIKLHGSSTLWLPKKSYNITTLNAQHIETKISLLGLPAESDWIFKALYQDKSLLHDELTFRLYNQMGHYSSRIKFFELVVDGNYRGVYELAEKIKRDQNRVNISKLNPTDVSGNVVTGGYIISLDKYGPADQGWYSNYFSNLTQDSANFFLYVYPKASVMPQVQKDYIKNYFNKFEDVLRSNYFNNPDSGYAKYINLLSFVDNFIINELSRNVDGYRSSTFFYKERAGVGDGKLHAGPVWDFDIAWGDCCYMGGNDPAGWQYQQFYSVNFIPFWWWQIMSDNSFTSQLKCRYQYLRSTILNEAVLLSHIDCMTVYLNESQARNFTRWPILGQVIYPNPSPAPATYSGEISNLKTWIQQRLAWMDANLPGVCNVGTGENELTADIFSSFPNPFINNFNIVYNVPEHSRIKIELLNALGSQVQLLFNGDKPPGVYEEEISAQQLSSGLYIVRMSINGRVFNQKLMKAEE